MCTLCVQPASTHGDPINVSSQQHSRANRHTKTVDDGTLIWDTFQSFPIQERLRQVRSFTGSYENSTSNHAQNLQAPVKKCQLRRVPRGKENVRGVRRGKVFTTYLNMKHSPKGMEMPINGNQLGKDLSDPGRTDFGENQ
ncbi:unnamed protein product [Caenorhabditis brenneri]